MAPGQGWLPVSVQRRLSGRLCDREGWSNVGFEHVMDESHTGQREGGPERSDTWKCFWRAPGWVQLQRKHPSTPSYILPHLSLSFHILPFPGSGMWGWAIPGCCLEVTCAGQGGGGAPPAFHNVLSFLFLPSSKQTKGCGVSPLL